MEQEFVKNIPSQWNNQFSIGVLHFYSIVHAINLMGTCLKIQLDPTDVLFETGTPLLVTLSSYVLSSGLFYSNMAVVAAGL